MEPTVLSAIVIALGSLAVALVTRSQNKAGAKATNELNERVVDREDFREVVDNLRLDLKRTHEKVEELEQRLEKEAELRAEADRRAVAAEQRAEVAEKRAELLERRVTLLEMVLTSNNIPIPPLSVE